MNGDITDDDTVALLLLSGISNHVNSSIIYQKFGDVFSNLRDERGRNLCVVFTAYFSFGDSVRHQPQMTAVSTCIGGVSPGLCCLANTQAFL